MQKIASMSSFLAQFPCRLRYVAAYYVPDPAAVRLKVKMRSIGCMCSRIRLAGLFGIGICRGWEGEAPRGAMGHWVPSDFQEYQEV